MHAVRERGIDHAIDALDLLCLGEHGDVVLEGVRDPEILHPHVGDTLVGVPIVLPGEGLVDAVVKVLVVREDDMAPDVVELAGSGQRRGAGGEGEGRLTKPSGVTSVEARPPGVSLESMIIHDGPFYL